MNAIPRLGERASGVLLHLTSLPGPHGSGDLGAEAVAFAETLARAEQRWWQMLPVGPCGYGDSPYSALSAFAGDPILVDLESLGVPVAAGEPFADGDVDYAAARRFREAHLASAHAAFGRAGGAARTAYEEFCAREGAWLEDWALYDAIKREQQGAPWVRWPTPLRDRDPGALQAARARLAERVS